MNTPSLGGLGSLGSLVSIGGIIYELFCAPKGMPPAPQKIYTNNYSRLAPVPIVYGTDLVAGSVIFLGQTGYQFIDISAKGFMLGMMLGGQSQEQMVYTAEFCVCMGEGPLIAITQIYVNDEPITNQNTSGPDTTGLLNLDYSLYLGTNNQIVNSNVSAWLTKGFTQQINTSINNSLTSKYSLFPYASTSNLLYADFTSVPVGYFNGSYGVITHLGINYIFGISNQEQYFILLGDTLPFTPSDGDVFYVVLNPDTSWNEGGNAIPWRNTGYIYLNGMIGTNQIPTIKAEVAGFFAWNSTSTGESWETIVTYNNDQAFTFIPSNADQLDLESNTSVLPLPDTAYFFGYLGTGNSMIINGYEVNSSGVTISWSKSRYTLTAPQFTIMSPGGFTLCLYNNSLSSFAGIGTTLYLDWIDRNGDIVTYQTSNIGYEPLYSMPDSPLISYYNGMLYVILADFEDLYIYTFDPQLKMEAPNVIHISSGEQIQNFVQLIPLGGINGGNHFRQMGIFQYTLNGNTNPWSLAKIIGNTIEVIATMPDGYNPQDIMYAFGTYYLLASSDVNNSLRMYTFGSENVTQLGEIDNILQVTTGGIGNYLITNASMRLLGVTIWINANVTYGEEEYYIRQVVNFNLNTNSFSIFAKPNQGLRGENSIEVWQNTIYESWTAIDPDDFLFHDSSCGFQYINDSSGAGEDANPIQCCYDFMTNTRYGMGMDPSLFDGSPTTTGSWANEYTFCNIMVTTPSFNASSINNFEQPVNVTEPRFRYSKAIGKPTKGSDIIKNILQTCRAFLYPVNGKIGVHIEKQNETPQFYFGCDSGSFIVTG